MEKLTIKELAPYLPYGLNILHTDRNIALIISGAYFKANSDKYFRYELLNWSKSVQSDKAKPILRPLSDIEDNEEIYKKWRVLYYDDMYIDRDQYGSESDCLEYFSDMTIDFVPKKILDFMFENHFDVFGLIEKGLAIDKNTL